MPSLRMLHRIMAELDSNISALFADNAADNVLIYREGERPVVRIAGTGDSGGIRLQRLAPVGEGRILEGNIHEVDPGANNGGEIKHEGEEIGYILTGELELTVAQCTFRLGEGASFHFRSDLPHSYRNPGESVTRILWINSPPTF
jgi:quercetin dioxygenase-like cupin family protein